MSCHDPQTPYPTDSVSALADIAKTQDAFQMLKLLMLTNYLFPKQAKLKDCDKFDFLIVGGGTAGCVLANRLAAANYTVLMLEAGDVQPLESFLPGTLIYLPKSRLDWNFMANPDKFTGRCHRNPVMSVPAGKVLGGSSSINFMIGFRGIVNDYHQWATASNDPSWEYRNLLPYFKQSERLQAPKISNCPTGSCRGVGGTPPDFGEEGGAGNIGIAQDNSTNIKEYLEAFADMGNEIVQDLSGKHSMGSTRGLYTIAEGYRQSTAYGYLVPAKKYPNLYVSKNTIVTKIIFDKDKKAIGVKASIDGKKEIFLCAKKEVILSAGVVKSPQLLMLSGIGPKKHLEEKNITVIADLPAVGENFHDQQVVTVLHRAKKITDPGPINFQTYPTATAVGYKSLEPCAGIPDYATITFIVERPHLLLQYCSFAFDFQPEICNSAYQQLLGKQLAHTHIVNLYPKSRGKVTLNSSNPHDPPLIDTGYFCKEEDMDKLVKYVKDFIPIVHTTYFKDVNGSILDPIGDKCSDFEYGTDDYWKCYVYCMSSSMWNYGGTCSMGSVVDSKLKVFGVKGLRVVDASVMPIVITGGNYVATIVIAEKASDMIKKEHQEK